MMANEGAYKTLTGFIKHTESVVQKFGNYYPLEAVELKKRCTKALTALRTLQGLSAAPPTHRQGDMFLDRLETPEQAEAPEVEVDLMLLLREIPWVVFDLETQRSYQEVKGWHNAHKMRVSIGCVWRSWDQKLKTYSEARIDDLFMDLEAAALIVGFNSKRFDYKVLSGYRPQYDFTGLYSFDLWEAVFEAKRQRYALDRLARFTLNETKLGDGQQALRWFQQGKLQLLIEYCKKDVQVTRDLFLHGVEKGFLRAGGYETITVDWRPLFDPFTQAVSV